MNTTPPIDFRGANDGDAGGRRYGPAAVAHALSRAYCRAVVRWAMNDRDDPATWLFAPTPFPGLAHRHAGRDERS